MNKQVYRNEISAFCAALLCLLTMAGGLRADDRAQTIIAQSGFTGGVAVHVHGADASLLQSIHRERPNMLGKLLVAQEDDARTAREALVAAGLHGKTTVGLWQSGTLPFIDSFVNLLIVEQADAVPREEVLRVLAPEGTALLGSEVLVKPRPDTLDDWPQQLHDASGNAVSKDKALKPPLAHMQWVGGPRWSRHHDKMSSVSACVSGDGKVFYIFDEGNTYSPYLPCHWKLIARDAFNGVVLWKQPIDEWIGNLYGLKSGPSTLPRRLVVAGKRVCATLGIEAPVSIIDTATGEILQTIPGTESTEEIIHEDGLLYLVADTNKDKAEFQNGPRMNYPRSQWIIRPKQVLCCDIDQGKVLWSKTFDWVAPSTLSTSRGKVYLFDGKEVVALSRDDGSVLWKSAELPVWKQMTTFYAPKLVVQGGVVMFVGGEGYVPHRGTADGKVTGLSTENGKTLWTAKHPSGGYQSPSDLLMIDGKLWGANTTSGSRGSPTGTGEVLARNPATGEEVKHFDDVPAYWFHHRCYPAKATEDYLITSRTGVEFVDVATGKWTLHHWVRGACLYGIMPANGLLYAPQTPCACYIGAKMYGFTALAPANSSLRVLQPVPDEQRLTTLGDTKATFPKEEVQAPGEWPTYRCDIARSGQVGGIGEATKLKWSVKLPGEMTQPVIADHKVLVADKDNPVLCAFDSDTGEPVWRFVPSGRIDSSPTIYKGLVYFGSSDGFVYCLDLDDGALRWKYQAAPALANHMYMERMEATHPVHGNVLVMNDRLYTVAGRSMFTDGGIRFLILDALTGRKIKEHLMDDKMPGTGEPLQMQHEILNMPQALSDLLSSNGKKIFMRYQPFDLDGNRLEIPFSGKRYGYEVGTYRRDVNAAFEPLGEKQKGEDAHLFSGTGFLDDSWWHRTYWIFGNYHASGHNGYTQAGAKGAPAGRMITFDKDRIYTWGRLKRYFRWSEEYVYHLHAKDYDYQDQWSVMLPILVRAMVASDDRLFVLGPKELMWQDQIKRRVAEDEVQQLMIEQEKALNGKSGSILLTVDKQSGKILSGLRMKTAPVLDGMAGAYGNLYLVTTDRTLSCLSSDGTGLDALSAETIAEFNEKSAPPAPRKKRSGPAKKAKTIDLPSKDAEFANLDQAHAYQTELGYRVASAAGQAGMVLKQLDEPLTGKVTLKCKLQYANGDGANNGYLSFGDSAVEAKLVKCGLREKMKTAAIVQGPLTNNEGATTPCVTVLEKPYELTVTVDLKSGDVTFQGGGVTVAAKLQQPMKSITHVGYCLNDSIVDFSPIEVSWRNDEIERKIMPDTVPEKLDTVLAAVGQVIVGQRDPLEKMLIAMLCNGHVLLEGVPGIAKTMMVSTLAQALSARFSRIQFTPDLLPGDLVGTQIYRQETGAFETHRGPVFANVVLADEINRSPAKVQSALLESMQERQVTLSGQTHKLPEPFMVLATQNPIEQEGTYSLPEAQVDRFMFKLLVEYPTHDEEHEIMRRVARTSPVTSVAPVATLDDVLAMRKTLDAVHLDERIELYILRIIAATRNPATCGLDDLAPFIRFGASPRASIYLALAARGHALMRRRDYVVPDDVKAMLHDVVRHRIAISYRAEAEGLNSDTLLDRIAETVPIAVDGGAHAAASS